MTKSEAVVSAHNSYRREVQRLKSFSPEWKPISLKEYVHRYLKKAKSLA